MMSRAAYEAYLAQRIMGFLTLAPGSDAECARFLDMALAAHAWAAAAGLQFNGPAPHDITAFDAVLAAAEGTRRRATPTPLAAWRAWAGIRRGLAASHPRLALFDLIREISGVALGRGWPDGIEGQFQDWADQEQCWLPAHCLRGMGRDEPWRRQLQGWHDRLRLLRREADGWFASTGGDIRFLPEEEWQRLRSGGEQG